MIIDSMFSLEFLLVDIAIKNQIDRINVKMHRPITANLIIIGTDLLCNYKFPNLPHD
jgi:hypothetical protein